MRRALGQWQADSRWAAHLATLKREGIVKLEEMMVEPVHAFLGDCDPEKLKPAERSGYRCTSLGPRL